MQLADKKTASTVSPQGAWSTTTRPSYPIEEEKVMEHKPNPSTWEGHVVRENKQRRKRENMKKSMRRRADPVIKRFEISFSEESAETAA